MKHWIGILLLAAVSVANGADAPDLEPAVRTSSAATESAAPSPPAAPAAPAASTVAPAPASPVAAPGNAPPGRLAHRQATAPSAPAGASAGAPVAAAGGAAPKAGARAHDSIDLDATQITGNRELPNVMYVVPWKKPDLGDFAGRPPKSLLDELLAPVDRDVFRRQNRYFAALHPDAAAAPAGAPAAVPASGAPATLPAGDEK